MEDMNFSPFVDLSKKTDEELNIDIGRLNAMMNYYYATGHAYLTEQLRTWKDGYYEEINNRQEKKALEREKKNNIIFDNSDESNKKEMDKQKTNKTTMIQD